MATAPTTKTIEELVRANPDVDNSGAYTALWSILTEFVNKLRDSFELYEDTYIKDKYQPYTSADGKNHGFVQGFHGPRMDWVLNSWTGNPETSFTNAHLNIWLGPQVRVPHLALVFGTVPDFFFYIDYVPRVDLQVNAEYLDKYFTEGDQHLNRMMNDKRYTPFFSQDPYMRAAMSPSALCFTTKACEEEFAMYRDLGHEYMDRWLGWIDEATPVPLEEQAAIARRDLWVRRLAIEKDPVNGFAEKLLGKELATDLVRTMWGGNRRSKRIIEDLNPQG